MRPIQEVARAIRNSRYEKSPQGLFLPDQKLVIGGCFEHEVIRDGRSLGVQRDPNLVVNEGLDHILNTVFNGQAQITTWYIGLFKGNYTPLATDNAANIATNATEVTEYAEAARVEYVEAPAASQSMTNSASKAQFTINAGVTVYGAFLCSSNQKSGTAGTLIAASRFASERILQNADELLIAYSITGSSS